MIDSDRLRNLYDKQLLASHLSAADLHRLIRTAKFPRFGCSIMDSDDLPPSYFDVKSNDELNVDDLQWLERRSVLFPRIGKRALYADDRAEMPLFHDSQPTDSAATLQYRDKRQVSM